MNRNCTNCVASTLALLLLISCSDNSAIRLRYDVEKNYFIAEKEFRAARIRPELFDESELLRIRGLYLDVLNQCYTALDSVDSVIDPLESYELDENAYRSGTRLSQFYFADKQFDSAANVLNDLLTRTKITDDNRMNCYYNLARALQSGGKFDSALAIYDLTIEKFRIPVTNDGDILGRVFNIPLNLHGLFRQVGDSLQAEERFDLALTYYQGLAEENITGEVSTAAHANLASLYASTGQWVDVINELLQIKDSIGQTPLNTRLQIADIYASELQQYRRALTIYAEIEPKLIGRDTLALPSLMYKQSLALIGAKAYRQARQTLVALEARFPFWYSQAAPAQLSKARTFDLEGNWERAVSEYKFLIDQYEGSREAMSTYLYLGSKFADRGQQELADEWYQKGLENFDEISIRTAGTKIEATAQLFIAEVYHRQGNLELSARTLTGVFDKFPQTEPGQRALLSAAAIYKHRLNQPKTADSLINTLKTTLAEVDEGPKI